MEKILISAGEASGDFYASSIISEISKIKGEDAEIIGFGGEKMKAAGADIRIELTKYAVVGLSEVLSKIAELAAAYKKAVKIIKNEKPDTLVVIDYPGFHMRLIKDAKKLGVKKVIYYITPQIWVWKYKRIFKIKKYTDTVIVILPFEKDIFEKEGVKVKYFGHPAASFIKSLEPELKDIEKEENLIGVFPGSRKGEIKRFFRDILDSCAKVKEKISNARFLIFRSNEISEEMLLKYTAEYPDLEFEFAFGNDFKARKRLSACIAKSGTTTLELALLGIPHVIVYKVNNTSYPFMKLATRNARIQFAGLPNIILGRQVVKELLQHQFTAENCAGEIVAILEDEEYRKKMIDDFRKIERLLYYDDQTNGRIADVIVGEAL